MQRMEHTDCCERAINVCGRGSTIAVNTGINMEVAHVLMTRATLQYTRFPTRPVVLAETGKIDTADIFGGRGGGGGRHSRQKKTKKKSRTMS